MLNESDKKTIDFEEKDNSKEILFLSLYLVLSILFSLFLGVIIGSYSSLENSKSSVCYSEVK
jgi:hypothetical protein